MEETTVREPSVSVLMYLFADRLIPEKKFRTVGTPVPCKEVQVQLQELAAGLFAVSLWSMREQGIIGLETFQARKMLVMSTTRVRVTRLRLDQSRCFGLEEEILKTLESSGEDHIHSLIRRWYGKDSKSPHLDVLQVVVREAVALGYIDRTETDKGRGAITGFFLGKTEVKFEPHCEKISTLEDAFDGFAARWAEFRSFETDLYGALMDQCKGAIASRMESDSDYDLPD